MKHEDIQDLKQLIEFLKESKVAEFELDRGDLKIRLKFAQAEPLALPQGITGVPGPAVPPPALTGAAAPEPGAVPSAEPDDDLHIVKSPIVGTFYGSPSPGAAPFVSPGDHVEKGQVVCIIEAMKLMNEIEADAAGEMVRCLVTNGQPIEFGQPLFAIRTS